MPAKLIPKLGTLGLNTSLCNWILDFLTGRPQVLRYIKLVAEVNEMADNVSLLMVLFLCFWEHVVADTDTDNESCFKIKPGTMASIIIADIVLTVVIVIVTYHWASRRRLQKERADKVYMNVRANCKT
ncbi:hypothetical protein DPEC_G00145580 [Dallia pectoralis]|uniref:Uncharacterized protein n=1 Tax=Dallia pectoralis TaxID=75939 RepID=A0ACC2GP51_DALPE|nr:hypothetical protein DPEC_G00145580 [Dallia pectoralis]